jgi:hypothetical protein
VLAPVPDYATDHARRSRVLIGSHDPPDDAEPRGASEKRATKVANNRHRVAEHFHVPSQSGSPVRHGVKLRELEGAAGDVAKWRAGLSDKSRYGLTFAIRQTLNAAMRWR